MRPDEEPRCHQCRAIAWINGICAVCGEEKPSAFKAWGACGKIIGFGGQRCALPRGHSQPHREPSP